MADPTQDRRQETQDQRDDRNLAELLQEVRIAGLGIQVLFGFLLAIPFTTGFAKLNQGERDLYIATVVLVTLATVLLLAPVAYHRVLFRRGQKEILIRVSNVLALAGLVTVALSISSAVCLILSYVAAGLPAIVFTAVVVFLFAALWFALPLSRRMR
jgi:hypothetical protein